MFSAVAFSTIDTDNYRHAIDLTSPNGGQWKVSVEQFH